MHLQTNSWWDLAHIRRANTFWSAPGLMSFWSYSTEFPPFPGLVSGLLSSFCTLPDYWSDLAKICCASSGLINLWSYFTKPLLTPHWISAISWAPIGGDISPHLQIQHRWDWAQTYWTVLHCILSADYVNSRAKNIYLISMQHCVLFPMQLQAYSLGRKRIHVLSVIWKSIYCFTTKYICNFYYGDNETNRFDLEKSSHHGWKNSITLFRNYQDYEVTRGTLMPPRFHNTCDLP